jgi:hypothetical protein
MHTFICLLTDIRYSVPTLVFLDAPTAEDAQRMAWAELEASACRRDFELLQDDRLIGAGRKAAPHLSAWGTTAAGLGPQVEIAFVEVGDFRQARP